MGKSHNSPFISSAGRDHVILSKQFAIVIGKCDVVIYFYIL